MQHPLHPTGRPVAEFFGRPYLRCAELIAMGLIPNRMTLHRMVRDGLFPPPLRLTPRILLWDSTEIATLLNHLGAERETERDGEKKPAATGTAGKKSKSLIDDDNTTPQRAAANTEEKSQCISKIANPRLDIK